MLNNLVRIGILDLRLPLKPSIPLLSNVSDQQTYWWNVYTNKSKLCYNQLSCYYRTFYSDYLKTAFMTMWGYIGGAIYVLILYPLETTYSATSTVFDYLIRLSGTHSVNWFTHFTWMSHPLVVITGFSILPTLVDESLTLGMYTLGGEINEMISDSTTVYHTSLPTSPKFFTVYFSLSIPLQGHLEIQSHRWCV